MSNGTHRWRSRLDTVLTVAAIAASLLAIAVLITLAWWVRSLSNPPLPETVLHSVPDRPPQPAVAAPRHVPTPSQRAAPAAVQQAAAVAAAAEPTAVPTRGGNDDAVKNRALGAALSRLGNDPELRRKLEAASAAP